jgi:hypothetical protein
MLAHCYCGYSSLALQHGFAQQRTPVVVVIVVETQQTHKNAASRTPLSLGRRQVRAGFLGREEKKKKTNVADKVVTAAPCPPLPTCFLGPEK